MSDLSSPHLGSRSPKGLAYKVDSSPKITSESGVAIFSWPTSETKYLGFGGTEREAKSVAALVRPAGSGMAPVEQILFQLREWEQGGRGSAERLLAMKGPCGPVFRTFRGLRAFLTSKADEEYARTLVGLARKHRRLELAIGENIGLLKISGADVETITNQAESGVSPLHSLWCEELRLPPTPIRHPERPSCAILVASVTLDYGPTEWTSGWETFRPELLRHYNCELKIATSRGELQESFQMMKESGGTDLLILLPGHYGRSLSMAVRSDFWLSDRQWSNRFHLPAGWLTSELLDPRLAASVALPEHQSACATMDRLLERYATATSRSATHAIPELSLLANESRSNLISVCPLRTRRPALDDRFNALSANELYRFRAAVLSPQPGVEPRPVAALLEPASSPIAGIFSQYRRDHWCPRQLWDEHPLFVNAVRFLNGVGYSVVSEAMPGDVALLFDLDSNGKPLLSCVGSVTQEGPATVTHYMGDTPSSIISLPLGISPFERPLHQVVMRKGLTEPNATPGETELSSSERLFTYLLYSLVRECRLELRDLANSEQIDKVALSAGEAARSCFLQQGAPNLPPEIALKECAKWLRGWLISFLAYGGTRNRTPSLEIAVGLDTFASDLPPTASRAISIFLEKFTDFELPDRNSLEIALLRAGRKSDFASLFRNCRSKETCLAVATRFCHLASFTSYFLTTSVQPDSELTLTLFQERLWEGTETTVPYFDCASKIGVSSADIEALKEALVSSVESGQLRPSEGPYLLTPAGSLIESDGGWSNEMEKFLSTRSALQIPMCVDGERSFGAIFVFAERSRPLGVRQRARLELLGGSLAMRLSELGCNEP